MARRIAIHEEIAFLVDYIFSICIRQTGKRVHSLSVVQYSIHIRACQSNLLGDDAAMNSYLFHTLDNSLHILFTQNASFIQCTVFQLHIACQNTSDKTEVIAAWYIYLIRMIEQWIERECIDMHTFFQLCAKRITLIAIDHGTAGHKYIAIRIQNILCKMMLINTVDRVQLLTQLIASSLCQVVTTRIKELRIHQCNGAIQCRDFIRTLIFVNGQ